MAIGVPGSRAELIENLLQIIVIENFYSKNIPLCGVLGGGYNKSFDKLIELHSMLHKNCAEII